MDITTCIKYLNFVSQECERLQSDGRVTDEELIGLIVEFQRFQEKVRQSSLPDELKTKVSEIKLNYSVKGVERGKWFYTAAIVTFGAWVILMFGRAQSQRKQALSGIKFDTSRLAQFIQLNY